MRNGKLGVRPGVSLLPNYFKNRLKFAKECQALKLIQSYLFNREIRFTMITLTKLYAKLIIPIAISTNSYVYDFQTFQK